MLLFAICFSQYGFLQCGFMGANFCNQTFHKYSLCNLSFCVPSFYYFYPFFMLQKFSNILPHVAESPVSQKPHSTSFSYRYIQNPPFANTTFCNSRFLVQILKIHHFWGCCGARCYPVTILCHTKIQQKSYFLLVLW